MSPNNEIQQTLEEETQELQLNDPDLSEETNLEPWNAQPTAASCPFAESSSAGACPYRYVPLRMGGSGGTHMVSEGSRSVMQEVTLDDLMNMTERFYKKAFDDPTLDQFIRSHDDPHGSRFAKWIHQKLSGSAIWDQDRRQRSLEPVVLAGGGQHVVSDRSSAHVAAWYSPKRPTRDVGRHFKLDECRVWMRLHFWAMRESGIMEKSPTFADYYVRFIGHFVKVYESSAPMFARDSFRWSANPENIAKYQRDGRMNDVIGVRLERAAGSLPASEAEDFSWPYTVQAVTM